MTRFTEHRKAKQVLSEIEKHPDKYLVIHYSCESFINTHGKSPRITSIAVSFLESGQRKNFAIHQIAEIEEIEPKNILDNYEQLEKKLLANFYEFVNNHNEYKWIHWNMRDSNFGFEAISQRFKVLEGSPISIADKDKVDLSKLLLKLYGENYIDDPRIVKLMQLNDIHPNAFLNGKQEAEAFESGKYVELSRSSSEKVNVISTFLNRATQNTLKVKSKKVEIYGNSLFGYISLVSDKSWGKILIWTLNLLIGGLTGGFIAKIFF